METWGSLKDTAAVVAPTELIIVCCHATYTGNGSSQTEADWMLQDFQRSDPATRKSSEHETFLQHIHSGALLAQQHYPDALLIFSGGRTSTSERTESASYAYILERLIMDNPAMWLQTLPYTIEEHATDSYQNLLFSILRFRHLTGGYPETITVVTHAFKERRFLDLHAPAIKWPRGRIRVHGINPPFTLHELTQTQDWEWRRACAVFERDPYGVRAPLAEKRVARNWSPDEVLVVLGRGLESEVAELLTWTGGGSGSEIFPKKLPWEIT